MPFRTRIEDISPVRVRLSSRRGFRLQVRGWVIGFVAVNRKRRWRFGRFDESFFVQDIGQTPAVVVWGLTGRAERTVTVRQALSMAPPQAPAIAALRVSFPRLFAHCPITVRTPQAPRLLGLTLTQAPSNKHD